MLLEKGNTDLLIVETHIYFALCLLEQEKNVLPQETHIFFSWKHRFASAFVFLEKEKSEKT